MAVQRMMTAVGLLLFASIPFLTAQTSPLVLDNPRVIVGDGQPPLERGTVLVLNGRIEAVGPAGTIAIPGRATRIDLSGKTIMPALVNLHSHLGFQRGDTYAAENYTRDNLIDNLQRYAYYGVGTVVSMGTDAGAIPNDIRRDQAAGGLIDTAWLRHAGRGFALPNAGPGAAAMRAAPYGVTTADEARRAVGELAAARADVVKIWVDDRNGTVPKLPPEIYRAIIEEAHRHKLQAIAHVYYLADAKELARAGIDGFAHPVRDAVMDDELIALMRPRNVFVLANLGLAERATKPGRPAWFDDPFLRDAFTPAWIDRVGEALAKRPEAAVARSAATYRLMEQSIARLSRAGLRVLLGSDSGVQDHFMGHAEHRELELMVASGMPPADVLANATGRAAEALNLDGVGTITRGKSADLLVVEANPLDDIRNTRRIAQVYLRGIALDREAARRSLAR